MSILVELPEDEYDPKAFAEFAPRAGFNIGTARAMAWISQLAYEAGSPEKVERIGRRWELDDISPFKQPAKSTLPLSSTSGVLAIKNDALIIAFAGTESAKPAELGQRLLFGSTIRGLARRFSRCRRCGVDRNRNCHRKVHR